MPLLDIIPSRFNEKKNVPARGKFPPPSPFPHRDALLKEPRGIGGILVTLGGQLTRLQLGRSVAIVSGRIGRSVLVLMTTFRHVPSCLRRPVAETATETGALLLINVVWRATAAALTPR